MLIFLLRTIIFYFITIIALRFMGKRQIGELEPSELVITILISELATIPLQDPESPGINIITAVFALVAIEIIFSELSLKSTAVSSFISGKYNIIVENGKINQNEMRKAQLTLGELFEEIRSSGALSINDVKFCILETNGKMSVFLRENTKQKSVPVPLIVDGKILKKNIQKVGLQNEYILREAIRKGWEIKDVFLLFIEDGELFWTKKE